MFFVRSRLSMVATLVLVSLSPAASGANLRAFITSTSGNGNLAGWADAGGQSGLRAADAVCAARANAAGIAGSFVAWMSDDNNDAVCRAAGLGGTTGNHCGQTAAPNAGPPLRTARCVRAFVRHGSSPPAARAERR